MALQVIKWISFGVAVLDLIGYVDSKCLHVDNISAVIGFISGIYLRVYLLYGALIYWILK